MSGKTSVWRTVSGFGATSVGGALGMSAAALGGDSLLEVETRLGGAGALLVAGVACAYQGCRMLRVPPRVPAPAAARVTAREAASDASRPRSP